MMQVPVPQQRSSSVMADPQVESAVKTKKPGRAGLFALTWPQLEIGALNFGGKGESHILNRIKSLAENTMKNTTKCIGDHLL
jgi:hypothetical protein